MQGNFSANEFRFVNDASRLREYIAFNPANALIPGKCRPHTKPGSAQFTANRLFNCYKQFIAFTSRTTGRFSSGKEYLKVTVVTTDKIFNEFSSGTPDPVAIRDFVKMYFDKAGSQPCKSSKIFLLFGDASFDYKNRIANNTNLFLPIKVKFFLIRLALIPAMISLDF